jgi:hypothetical protein
MSNVHVGCIGRSEGRLNECRRDAGHASVHDLGSLGVGSAPSSPISCRYLRPSRRARAPGYRNGGGKPNLLVVKVCRHCAEELPDEATVCSQCHKDPAAAPAWSVPRRPDEGPPWWSDAAFDPNRAPHTPQGVPAPYERLEPAAAREGLSGVPSQVWVSLILWLAWGRIVWQMSANLPWQVGLIAVSLGYIVGLVLANLGRVKVKKSDRLGQLLAIAAIALNAVALVSTVVSMRHGIASFDRVLPALVLRG